MNSFVKSVFTLFWIGYLFLMTTFMFPTSYNWLFDNESQRQIITTILNLLGLISIGITVKKLWMLKALPKKTKSDWTFLIIFGYPIIFPFFTWKSLGNLKKSIKKVYDTKVIAKALDGFFVLSFPSANFPLSYTVDKFRYASPCLKLQTITLIVINNEC